MPTEGGQPVELHKGDLATAGDEGVGVDAAAVDVAEVCWNAHVIKQVADLQHTRELSEGSWWQMVSVNLHSRSIPSSSRSQTAGLEKRVCPACLHGMMHMGMPLILTTEQ